MRPLLRSLLLALIVAPGTACATGFTTGLNDLYFDHWVPLFEAAQAKDNAVRKDLTEGLALDFNTAGQKVLQANARGQTYADEQAPPGMPCGANGCTGQQSLSAVIAGSEGVMGSGNPVSGNAAQASRADRAITTPQGAFGAIVTYQAHCGQFASQAEIQAGVCPSATASPKPNADLDGSTLLSAPKVGSDPIHAKLDAQARAAIIHNLTDTMPVAKLKKPNYGTVTGETGAGLQMSMQARMNVAQTILSQVAAMRAPIAGFGPQMQKTLSKNLGGVPAIANNASLDQALSWQDQATYGNPKWYFKLQSLHGASVEKQRLLMVAEKLQHDYLRFRMETNEETALATMLAQQTQEVMRHEVERQGTDTAQ
ncbi:MAG: hypothetical protein M1492_01515 [Gammaproteobacteria bacterium]|nr:hypothetical protein [Gammaproteobacteria bacterium]